MAVLNVRHMKMNKPKHLLSNIDKENRVADCVICGAVHIFKNGRQDHYQCGKAARIRWVKNKYGLSEQQYNDLLDKQGEYCAICGDYLISPHVDHDHKTGNVRGLLCADCNQGLGHFRDSPENCYFAHIYLLGQEYRDELSKRWKKVYGDA
jgi:hypothetical protein